LSSFSRKISEQNQAAISSTLVNNHHHHRRGGGARAERPQKFMFGFPLEVRLMAGTRLLTLQVF